MFLNIINFTILSGNSLNVNFTSPNFLTETLKKFDIESLLSLDVFNYSLLLIIVIIFVKNYYNVNSVQLSNILQNIIKSGLVILLSILLFFRLSGFQ